jgi:uncharacterized protein DUF5681
MSGDPDSKPKRHKKIADTEDGQPGRHAAGSPYEVGYGKPPVSTRFVKGQSGNPRGRPRKIKPKPPRLSDAPSDGYLEKEAYRLVALRENGLGIELPTIQAVLRALAMGAIKGNRLSQKFFLEYIADKEERYLQLKVRDYLRLEALKENGERRLVECKRRGLPPPTLLPHPEDIVLNPATGEAYIKGPQTPEDVAVYEHASRLRDCALLQSAHASKLRKKSSPKPESDGICAFLFYAQILNRMLPPRYRWRDNADLNLFMDYRCLTKRERERRIEAEAADLDASKSKLPPLTPEMEWELNQVIEKMRRGQSASSDSTVTG